MGKDRMAQSIALFETKGETKGETKKEEPMKYKPYKELSVRQKAAVWLLMYLMVLLAQKLMGIELKADISLFLFGVVVIIVGVLYGDSL